VNHGANPDLTDHGLDAFWADCVEEQPDGPVPVQVKRGALYGAYFRWAVRRGVAPVGRYTFYRLAAARAPGGEDRNSRRVVYLGARLRHGCGPDAHPGRPRRAALVRVLHIGGHSH